MKPITIKIKEKSFKKVTISDIARLAGVSKATVSRVLSGSSFVNTGTRDRILKIIKEKKYRPSSIAQSLRTKKTKTIGLVLADIENPFFSRVAKGVINAVERKKYKVILCNSDYNIESEEESIKTLIGREVDGLLLTTVEIKMNTIEDLKNRGIPFLLIDCKLDIPNVNYVVNDDYYGAQLAAEYLIKLGHKKLFFLGNEKLLSLRERFRGFKDTLKQHKIDASNALMPKKFGNMDNVYDVVKNLLNRQEKVTAIFAGNDDLAIKAIEVIIGSGFKVPENISVIGYDNIKIASIIRVPLTTISQPKYLLGKLAAEQLLEIIEGGPDRSEKRIVLSPELIIRESCRRIQN